MSLVEAISDNNKRLMTLPKQSLSGDGSKMQIGLWKSLKTHNTNLMISLTVITISRLGYIQDQITFR